MNTFFVRRIGIFFVIVGMACALAVSARPAPQAAGLAAGGAIRKGIGSTSAPITMEVFGDFQCPACRSFFEGTVKQVIDDLSLIHI